MNRKSIPLSRYVRTVLVLLVLSRATDVRAAEDEEVRADPAPANSQPVEVVANPLRDPTKASPDRSKSVEADASNASTGLKPLEIPAAPKSAEPVPDSKSSQTAAPSKTLESPIPSKLQEPAVASKLQEPAATSKSAEPKEAKAKIEVEPKSTEPPPKSNPLPKKDVKSLNIVVSENSDKLASEVSSVETRQIDATSSTAKPPIVSRQRAADERPRTELTLAQRRIKLRIESCLAYYLANPESVVKRSPWALMHAMLPYGVDTQVVAGNRHVNVIGWMCYNGVCRTQQVFDPAAKTLVPNVGDGMQGHDGQFLAMLAQSSVAADYPIRVNNRAYTVTDLIRYEMATCREGTELTFKLIGLSHYLPPDQPWMANDNKRWDVEKLVREELAQPIHGAACGGTHRLMGLTYAVKVRHAQGLPIDGDYYRAAQFIEDYIQYTWTLQNPDGSFSTRWFEGRGNDSDMDRKVQTTGHMLEWLIFATPSSQLESPRIHKCIEFLVSNLYDDREHNWAIGPRSHALRALALYDERVFGVQPGTRHAQLASLKTQMQTRR